MTAEQKARQQAFGTALRIAREHADLTQTQLGARVDRRQATVSDWEKGATAPLPTDAAELERALRLDPGTLTRHLGYLPLDAAGEILPCTVIDAVLSDPTLDEVGRQALLMSYRALSRSR